MPPNTEIPQTPAFMSERNVYLWRMAPLRRPSRHCCSLRPEHPYGNQKRLKIPILIYKESVVIFTYYPSVTIYISTALITLSRAS
uniref:Uncharacterized protein n=1 Tax=Picea glauca TaxID=3330 RepID=A0A101LZL6_PICGL|nr:hypothetical protein ABT39_MTgene5129 [Picea glauca]QHR86421.1 hypothetical protein Q903MT_gene420 [Picea sitchensis]